MGEFCYEKIELIMADLEFTRGRIRGITTVIGDMELTIDQQKDIYDLSDQDIKKFKRNLGLVSKHVVSNDTICTSDLCVQSANNLLKGLGVSADELDAVVFVTQTPDYRAPSTAIHIAHRLGCPKETLAFDVSLGCSGFVYGLSIAFSYIESGLDNVLLLCGDVASSFTSTEDKSFSPLMGDAGSAILIDSSGTLKTYFQLYSDGSGYKSLFIPGSGIRGGDENCGVMQMNGAEVFNFTIKEVPKMFDTMFDFAGIEKDDIDYYVLHQPNKYILKNIRKRINVGLDKMPSETQANYGNQNSASITGTINAYLYNQLNGVDKKQILFSGFGIGLSWGICITNLDGVYVPKIEKYKG